VTGNGSFSFVLVPDSNDGLYVNAREAGSNRPELRVVTDAVGAAVDGGVADAAPPAGDLARPADAGVGPAPGAPLRAAFYYPWFPETWGSAANPFTQYHPSEGLYDSSDAQLLGRHVAAM